MKRIRVVISCFVFLSLVFLAGSPVKAQTPPPGPESSLLPWDTPIFDRFKTFDDEEAGARAFDLDRYRQQSLQAAMPAGLRGAGPKIQVMVYEDDIEGSFFPASLPVTVSIAGGPTLTKDADSSGYVSFHFYPYFDLAAGQVIEVRYEGGSFNYQVQSVSVESIDANTGTLSGKGDPDISLSLSACVDGCATNETMIKPDAKGNWSYSFAGITNIAPNSWGYAMQSDAAGNVSSYYWYLPYPALKAYPLADFVEIRQLEPSQSGTLSIGLKTWTFTADRQGFAHVETEGHDLVPGDKVIVQQGAYGTEHTVLTVKVTNVTQSTGTVSGTAAANAPLELWAADMTSEQNAGLNADANGNWSISYAPILILSEGSRGTVAEFDAKGNATVVNWLIPWPLLAIYPQIDAVELYSWPQNSVVSVTVGGVGRDIPVDAYGYAFQKLSDTDIQAGETVAATDGLNTVAHQVVDLKIDGVDLKLGQASGTIEPNKWLSYGLYVNWYTQKTDFVSVVAGGWTIKDELIKQMQAGSSISLFSFDGTSGETIVFYDLPAIYLPVVTR